MREFRFDARPGLRREWVRYGERAFPTVGTPLRAGVAGAYLPRLRLEVPHQPQERLSHSVPQCVSMVLHYEAQRRGRALPAWAGLDWLCDLLSTDDYHGTPGRRLQRLRSWGVSVDFPDGLQFFRDGTLELDRRLARGPMRLTFRWEERWLRFVITGLREGLPAILFVDLSRLYSAWRGFRQPHAVVLSGGDGRQAWIHDPSRSQGPTRVGLGTLLDALLPGEPLAAQLSLGPKVQSPRSKAPGSGVRGQGPGAGGEQAEAEG